MNILNIGKLNLMKISLIIIKFSSKVIFKVIMLKNKNFLIDYMIDCLCVLESTALFLIIK